MERKELIQILRTARSFDDVDQARDRIAEIIPAIRIMFEYDQKNHAHQYDLWEHCVQTVINLPESVEDDMVFLAALLHDIGKPVCQQPGRHSEDPNMHYYGHPRKSMEIVKEQVLPYLYGLGIQLSEAEEYRLLY